MPSAMHEFQITPKLLDEWHAFVQRSGAQMTQAACDEFATSHRLTPADIDQLLAALAASYSTTPRRSAADSPKDIGADEARQKERMEVADPLARMLAAEAVPVPSTGSVDAAVADAYEDLVGDWTRAGRLTHDQVTAVATEWELSARQLSQLMELLRTSGVVFDERVQRRQDRPAREAPVTDSIGWYLRRIARYLLIDAGREVELWSAISQGSAAQAELDATRDLSPQAERDLQRVVAAGRRAHDELVCANLRLVVSIARQRRYDTSGVELADRIQDGNLGLMRAADKFDGAKGFKFSTYATWWIHQAIHRGIADRGRTIRVPVHVHEKMGKVHKAVRRLAARLDREPTLTEIAEDTGLDPGEVQAIREAERPVRSLDALLGEDGDLRLSDVVADDAERDGRIDPANIVVQSSCRIDLVHAMATGLDPRAVEILRRRYGLATGDDETLDSIGTVFGLSRERIRQIEGKSLKTLRGNEEIAALHVYLSDGPVPTAPFLPREGRAS